MKQFFKTFLFLIIAVAYFSSVKSLNLEHKFEKTKEAIHDAIVEGGISDSNKDERTGRIISQLMDCYRNIISYLDSNLPDKDLYDSETQYALSLALDAAHKKIPQAVKVIVEDTRKLTIDTAADYVYSKCVEWQEMVDEDVAEFEEIAAKGTFLKRQGVPPEKEKAEEEDTTNEEVSKDDQKETCEIGGETCKNKEEKEEKVENAQLKENSSKNIATEDVKEDDEDVLEEEETIPENSDETDEEESGEEKDETSGEEPNQTSSRHAGDVLDDENGHPIEEDKIINEPTGKVDAKDHEDEKSMLEGLDQKSLQGMREKLKEMINKLRDREGDFDDETRHKIEDLMEVMEEDHDEL